VTSDNYPYFKKNNLINTNTNKMIIIIIIIIIPLLIGRF